ncbi:MAG: tetratricopeptide repeat protein [Syntrophobacteraceae bacterium]|nr:tetratricopeptide repeat protein [Syntrophobacteraceae bacterium]
MIQTSRPMVLALFLVLALLSCAHTNPDPMLRHGGETLTDIGEKYLAAGELGLSIKVLMEAEKKRPKDPKVHYLLGIAYDQRGIPDKAVEHFDKAIELKPDYSEAYNSLGAHYAENGNLQKAEENFKKALENPAYVTPFYAFYNLGRVYEKQGRDEEALRQYQQAVRLEPSYGVAFYRMGLILERLQRVDEAREALGSAIRLNPNITEAQLRYGILSYNVGDIERAMTSLSRVIKVSPYSTMASEARSYLDRMRGVVGAGKPRGLMGAASERASTFEVVPERETTRAGTGGGIARSERPAGDFDTGAAASVARETAPPMTAPPPAAGESDRGETGDSHHQYVVQVGTFRDKDNAERTRERLVGMGYEAVVRTFSHQTLGSMYSVQIRQIEDFSIASALVAEIERAERFKPIILKVRTTP